MPKAVKTPVACLPNKKPRARQLCSVMGWGRVDPDHLYGVDVLKEAKVTTPSARLKNVSIKCMFYVQLPIVPGRTCRRAYREFLISNNMVCAGWNSGRTDTCGGDSGGGLMCPSKRNSKTIYSVQGITSFGDGCGRPNKFGIYTNVINYVKWIDYIMNHYS